MLAYSEKRYKPKLKTVQVPPKIHRIVADAVQATGRSGQHIVTEIVDRILRDPVWEIGQFQESIRSEPDIGSRTVVYVDKEKLVTLQECLVEVNREYPEFGANTRRGLNLSNVVSAAIEKYLSA
jgi:hypothetical protein